MPAVSHGVHRKTSEKDEDSSALAPEVKGGDAKHGLHIPHISLKDELAQATHHKPTSKLIGDTTDLTQLQRVAIDISEHHIVESAMGALILFNLLLLIFETDATVDDGSAPVWISTLNYMLIAIYTSELCLKLVAYRWKFFLDSWNVMDFTVISSDIILICLDIVIGDMPKVSVLRMFRLVRLMRAFKALSMFPELALLLQSFACAARAIFWGLLLIMVVITIWSIMAVQLIHPLNKDVASKGVYDGCERCPRAFSSVFQSNLTIFQTIVAGDSWGAVAVPLIENFPVAGLFFGMVLASVGVGIINLILAVIVDSAQGTKQASMQEIVNQKEAEFKQAAALLLEMCAHIDTDNSGCLSKEELMTGFDTDEFANQMQVMAIGKEDMSAIFDVLDSDGSGDVSYKELVDQLYKFRTPDLRTAIYELTKLHQKVQNLFKFDKEEGQKNHELLVEMMQSGSSAKSVDGNCQDKLNLAKSDLFISTNNAMAANVVQAKDLLAAGVEDHLRHLGEQLQTDMRQLLQDFSEHSRLLTRMDSGTWVPSWRVEQLRPAKWDMSVPHEITWDEQPAPARAEAKSPQDLGLRMPEASLLSEPKFRAPRLSPSIRRRPVDLAEPRESFLGFGTCCSSQSKQAIVTITE